MADVSLASEIDAIDSYLSIESARFGDRLEIEVEVPEILTEAQVPNFILQPLVENAIKHGVSRLRGPASIRVAAEKQGNELLLEVVNRSAGYAEAEEAGHETSGERSAPDRASIGLANVRQRLAILYGERGRLETTALPDGYRALIRMPLSWPRRREAAE
jgi:LytS/YehU family sensor histidine kinase